MVAIGTWFRHNVLSVFSFTQLFWLTVYGVAFYVFYFLRLLIFFLFSIIYRKLRNSYYNKVGPEIFWREPRRIMAEISLAEGRLLHGFELKGLENLTKGKPSLMVLYHSHIAHDVFYMVSKMRLMGHETAVIIDRGFHNGIFRDITEMFKLPQPTLESCIKTLRRGDNLMVTPGGNYEAGFSDNNYQLFWRNRLGFANVAIEANVPIVPVFTENVRQVFITFPLLPSVFHTYMYNMTRLASKLFGFYLPVKLVTHIGKPIKVEDGVTPEELYNKVHSSMEELIKQNQTLPGRIWKALLQRFRYSSNGSGSGSSKNMNNGTLSSMGKLKTT